MEDSIPCGQEARAVSHQSLADWTHVLWLRKEAVLATVSHQLRPVFIIFLYSWLYSWKALSPSFKGVPHIREEVGVDDHTHHIHVCPHKGSMPCFYFELYPWQWSHHLIPENTWHHKEPLFTVCSRPLLFGTRRVCPLLFNACLWQSLPVLLSIHSPQSSFLTAFGSICHIGFLSDKTFLVQ